MLRQKVLEIPLVAPREQREAIEKAAEEPSPLGLMSHRDRYILRRASSVMAQAFPQGVFGPEDFGSEEQMLQAAIEASLISTPLETRGEADRTSTSRSLEEAGIKTPDSSRRDGKRRSDRRR